MALTRKPGTAPASHQPDSRYAMWRLLLTLLIMTIGSSGMYVVAVVIPAVQAEFGIDRAQASLPYTLLMIGFAAGGMLMGRLADRFGIMWPLLGGSIALGLGYVACSMATGIATFIVAQAVLVGMLGSAAAFAPLVADTSLWFERRRGIAVGICASGNYIAGAIWPPIVQHFVDTAGWRQAYLGMGIFCGVTMFSLALLMRARPPAVAAAARPAAAEATSAVSASLRPFGFSLGTAQALLCVASTACCVAMAMPQVHIVAYCTDLGFGAARGAQMLSLMLACGIVSRVVSGFICDRIGGLRTLMLGSALQGLALLLFLPVDGLVPLFVVSALFGLFQGGIVPSYAIIVREYFPPAEVGARVGTVLMFTMLGMALGGWMSGKVFDLTGSYHSAFIAGIAWNLLNMGIAFTLWWRVGRRPPSSTPRTAASSP
ncbi:MFS transporter [Variovorax sp. KK3]|uniref:MFS transporter n=1 Tax=Variovorax sp. KK3 TaxID=1855728 RepID=UPI00097BEAAF|nr:MFS transporter [Variovorax sp. KK3]